MMDRAYAGSFAEWVATSTPQSTPTPTQLETLRYASHGLEAAMIAEVRCLSEWTVKGQLADARRRLAAKNTTHAVAIALRLGMIP